MQWDIFVILFQIIYFLYFIGLNIHYLLLNISAMFYIVRHQQARPSHAVAKTYSGFELPVTIIVPSYNEEKTIEGSILALLQLNYPEYEIVVVNDGSRDNTLKVLIDKFGLAQYPEPYRISLPVKPIRGFYRSTKYHNVRVIDKENGGKSDALNAGINLSHYPLFCSIDADSLLARDSLLHVVGEFLDNPETIACGGTIRIANGCQFKDGHMVRAGLSTNPLALIQTVEYLRAFLFGRLGWVPLNALLIISGSFSLFKKNAVIEVGGYKVDVMGEDMELVVRLHRHFRVQGKPYKIVAIPEPICYTEAPEDLRSLKNQRIRWQRGLCESLSQNFGLLLHPRGGFAGWVSFPLALIFEWFGPLLEMSGYIFFFSGFLMGLVSLQAFLAFLLVSIGFGMFISTTTIVLEEISFRVYPGIKNLGLLFMTSLFENLGFRQLNTLWRFIGIIKWLFRVDKRWGHITRHGTNDGAAQGKEG